MWRMLFQSKSVGKAKETQENDWCSQNWVFKCEECDYKVYS